MPDPANILAGLSEIANRYWLLAAGFHLAAVVVAALAWRGWRPTRRLTAALLLVPLATVAAAAAAVRNPFNAGVFLALVVALAFTAARLAPLTVTPGPPWSRWAGVAMIAFGLLYPHFLTGRSLAAFLYAAPTGLIPCPTLSLAIGVSLALGSLGSRAWSWILGLAGLFYGAFGAARLGVRMDTMLILGAVALLGQALGPGRVRGTLGDARPGSASRLAADACRANGERPLHSNARITST